MEFATVMKLTVICWFVLTLASVVSMTTFLLKTLPLWYSYHPTYGPARFENGRVAMVFHRSIVTFVAACIVGGELAWLRVTPFPALLVVAVTGGAMATACLVYGLYRGWGAGVNHAS